MNNVEINQVLAQMRALSARTKVAAETTTEKPGQFADMLSQSINMVNETQSEATALKRSFQSGAPDVELPEVMVALQKASVSFEAMKQVRNKLLTAYQEISSMQV